MWNRAILLTIAGLLAAVGCQSIAGIEDRTYDLGDPGKDATAGTGGTGGGTGSPACQKYCDQVMKGCVIGTGDSAHSQLYVSRDVCLGVCALLDRGDPNDAVGNTLECRAKQAELVQSEPQSCLAAGPGGNGTCGTNCRSYCALFEKVCKKQFDEDKFTNQADCERKCRILNDNGGFDSVKDHDGDSLQCRLVHVSSAALPGQAPAAAEEHCKHARLIRPAAYCIPNPDAQPDCNEYCRAVMIACTDALKVYESEAQCQAVCKVLPKGPYKDTTGDNVGCRTYHVYNSLTDPASHCPHAGPGGDGHCGKDNCAAYCLMAKSACGSDFTTTYPGGQAGCEADCRTFGPDAGAGPNSGYSVATAAASPIGCRVLHAAKALQASEAASKAAECASALGGGDCQ